jgi:alpha-D-xyloside xylohydrolase
MTRRFRAAGRATGRGLLAAALLAGSAGLAQAAPLATLDRYGAYVSIEPYAPNIVRVTIATQPDRADAKPGYGIIAPSDATGWTHQAGPAGDSFSSSALRVTVAPAPPPHVPSQMEAYFAPALPPASVTVAGADGKPIVTMTGWEMAPHTVNGEKTFRAGASFSVTPGEHFYGLGQNQEGTLDLSDRTIDCRHWYDAPAGEQVCVPFMVSNRNYAILWDNPSPTTVSANLAGRTHIASEVGERVSFFVVTGPNSDALYAGYAKLTGPTPIPPKAAFGLIQSKARYESQAELTGIADEYRRRNLPLDVMVLDWFYWTRMGQLDIDPKQYPDAQAMNDHLHGMGEHSIISVWPRFERTSRYYNDLSAKGWLLHDKDGNVVDGLPVRSDRAGALLDSTNPDARAWFWSKIRDNIFSHGFDYTWLDETEPDLVPDGFFYSIGSGDRYHNLFPLVHTASVAEGSAKDRPGFRNLILCRAAYLGSQRNGCLFWSSDVNASWDALRRQVPAGLDFTASGLAYWSSDTGGWQTPGDHQPDHAPLLDPAGQTAITANYPDYPELFTRWFEYNALTPTLRIHGQRQGTAIWQYGSAALPVLEQWLRFRYSLIPYLYAAAKRTSETGAPFMRALFMDFPNDPAVATIGDQYMLGSAFLVAPVTTQGATSRRVYLPAGSDWYDWWTNARLPGGQWITAAAPIDKLPLYVRAGSIVPLGAPVLNTMTRQPLSEIRVFPGRDASTTLFDDHGVSPKPGRSATLRWDDAAHRLSASGPLPTGQVPASLVKVVGS